MKQKNQPEYNKLKRLHQYTCIVPYALSDGVAMNGAEFNSASRNNR